MGRSPSILTAITSSAVNSVLLLLIIALAVSVLLLLIRSRFRIPGNQLLLAGLAIFLPVMNPSNLGAKAGSGGGSVLSVNLSCADLLVAPAVLYILYRLISRDKPLQLPLIGILASYFVMAIVSLYVGSVKLEQEFIKGSHFVDMAKVMAVMIYFYVIINLLDTMKDLKVFLRAWAYTAPVIALIGIAGSLLFLLFHVSTFAAGGFRASSTLGNPNLLSGYVVLSIFITSLYMQLGGKRLHCSLFILIHLTALTLTSSKGGMLALCAGGATFFLLTPEYRRKIVAVLALALLVMVTTYFVSDQARPIFDRFLSIGGPEESSSIGKRVSLWTESLEVWEENILLGVGKGNSHAAADGDSEPVVGRGKWKDILTDGVERGGGVSHSIYVSILCENGLIGFILFMGIFLYFIITLFKEIWVGQPGSTEVAARVFLLAALLASLAQGTVTNVEDFRGLWVLLALIWVVSKKVMLIHPRSSNRRPVSESSPRLHHKEAAPA